MIGKNYRYKYVKEYVDFSGTNFCFSYSIDLSRAIGYENARSFKLQRINVTTNVFRSMYAKIWINKETIKI